MNILWFTHSAMTREWMVGSLDSLNWHETSVIAYDQKCPAPVDKVMLDAIDDYKPNAVIYIGTAAGPYLAKTETFLEMRNKGIKTIHLCYDGADPDYHPLLEEYAGRDVFTITVNCDGNDDWPSRPQDLTLWCSSDPRPYSPDRPLLQRPHRFGWCGGAGAGYRLFAYAYLQRAADLVVKEREEQVGTYGRYANFMSNCKIVLNMCWCGSGKADQFKARCIETGFAGAVLLEQKGSCTPHWLRKDIDYIEFHAPDHAVDIVKDLTDERMVELASNLHHTCKTHFMPEHFWKQVFARLA